MAAVKKVDLKKYIRDVPDWPKKGILFRDITPLLGNAKAFTAAANQMTNAIKKLRIDYVASVEARGFIFGPIIANKIKAGFIPVRKKGKLPHTTVSVEYALEYGTDCLEVHADAIKKGKRVLMMDDLLATGGTMAAACKLIEKVGGKIEGVLFLIELEKLGGRKNLSNYNVISLIKF